MTVSSFEFFCCQLVDFSSLDSQFHPKTPFLYLAPIDMDAYYPRPSPEKPWGMWWSGSSSCAVGSFQVTLLSLLAKDLTFPQQPEPCVHLHICYMVWSNTMARQPVAEFIWLMVPEGWESILEGTRQQKAVTAAGSESWELTSWTRRHKAERARTGSSLRV